MGAAVTSAAASSVASLAEFFAMSSSSTPPPKKEVEVSLNCCSDCGEHEHPPEERREHSGK